MRLLTPVGLAFAFVAAASPQVIESAIVSDTSAILTTTTIYGPESQTGKDQPVTTIMETWPSERTSTLTGLTTTEPDPALFQPPTGYRIGDETSPFTIQIPR